MKAKVLLTVGWLLSALACAQQSDLVFDWQLSATTGSKILDAGPRGLNADLRGGVTVTTGNGSSPSFASFQDGVASIALSATPHLDVQQATIEIWFRTDSLKPGYLIFQSQQSPSGNSSDPVYALLLTKEGFPAACVNAQNAQPVTRYYCVSNPRKLVSPGRWHMVAMTFDGKVLALYLDGHLVMAKGYTAADKKPAYAGTGDFCVVASTTCGNVLDPQMAGFTGDISRIKFYATAHGPSFIGQEWESSISGMEKEK